MGLNSGPEVDQIVKSSDSSSGPKSGLRRMLGGSAFIFVCRIAGAALTLITQILLARWMGAEELGVYVIAFSWCLLLATVANLGLPMAAVRFVGIGLAQGRQAYIQGFVRFGSRTTLLASLLAAAIGLILVWQLPIPDGFRSTLSFALLTLPVIAGLQYQCGLANSFSNFGLGFIPSNVARPLVFFSLVASFWLMRIELSASAAMALQLAAVAVVALVTLWLVRTFLRSRLGDVEPEYHGREWLRASVPMLATILFSGYFAEIIIILIGFALAPEEVARFHVSFRLALLISFGLFAIDTATAPDLARHYAAGDFAEVDRVVKQATRLRIAGALLATGVFAVAGRWALSWFGPEFVAGYPLLLILACGQLVQSAVGPAARLMSISGHQDQALAVSAGALLLAIVLVILLVPRYGALGAAVAATLDLALWALTMRFMLRRSTGLKIRVF